MILIHFFIRKKQSITANLAKKRLQTIINERKIEKQFKLNCLPQFKNDLIQVIHKYINETNIISIQLKKQDINNPSVLELNIFFSQKNI